MWFLFAFVFAVLIFCFVGKRPARLLKRGQFVRAQQIEVQGKLFYFEEVAFAIRIIPCLLTILPKGICKLMLLILQQLNLLFDLSLFFKISD